MRVSDGSVTIHASCRSCFSAEAFDFSLDLRGHAATVHSRVASARGSDPEAFATSMAREEAEAFVTKILAVVQKPEQLRGDRSTKVYDTIVEWDFGGDTGRASSHNSEMEVAELEDALQSNRMSAQLRERLSAAVAMEYHNWAHEVFRIAKDFWEPILRAKNQTAG